MGNTLRKAAIAVVTLAGLAGLVSSSLSNINCSQRQTPKSLKETINSGGYGLGFSDKEFLANISTTNLKTYISARESGENKPITSSGFGIGFSDKEYLDGISTDYLKAYINERESKNQTNKIK